MRCDVHCPQQGGSLTVAAVATVAVAVGVVWSVLGDILLAAGITVGVLCVAGLGLFVWLVRPAPLSGPVRSALPAPVRPHALGGARPAAIESRRIVPGVVLGTAESERLIP